MTSAPRSSRIQMRRSTRWGWRPDDTQPPSWTMVNLENAVDIIAHVIVTAGRKAAAAGRVVADNIRRALADERRNRVLIEQEIHRGHYRLSSKNDDDLPVIR